MRVLVNGVSVDMHSARHVLFGHLRQLAGWTEQSHQFVVLTAPNEIQPLELQHDQTLYGNLPRDGPGIGPPAVFGKARSCLG